MTIYSADSVSICTLIHCLRQVKTLFRENKGAGFDARPLYLYLFIVLPVMPRLYLCALCGRCLP